MSANDSTISEAGRLHVESETTDKAGTMRLADFVYRYALVGVLLATIVFFSIVTPDTFFTTANFETIVSAQAILMVVALGLTIPLTAGEFDLSIASVISFSSALIGTLTVQHGMPAGLAVAIAIACGVLIGLINGIFVVRLGVNSFITTLGSGTLVAGITTLVGEDAILPGVLQPLVDVARTELLGLPLPVFYGLALAALLWFMYEYTPIGRHLFFVGQGRDAARLAGVRVDRLRVWALVASATLASVAGVILVGKLGASDPNVGSSFLLPAFAAAFLGATAIKPGRFNAWGTVIALYLLITGITGLQLLGATSWIENAFNGAALILGVALSQLAGKRTATGAGATSRMPI